MICNNDRTAPVTDLRDIELKIQAGDVEFKEVIVVGPAAIGQGVGRVGPIPQRQLIVARQAAHNPVEAAVAFQVATITCVMG